MFNYLTYIFLSFWPIFQLIKIYSLEGDLFVVDVLKPFVVLLLFIAVIKILLGKNQIRIGRHLILWLIYFLYLLFNVYLIGSPLSLKRIFAEQYNVSIMPLVLYFIIDNLGKYFKKKALIYSIIISGLIIVGVGLAEYFAGHNLIGSANLEAINIQSVYRTNGPFHEAIGYSATVLLYIPFIYYYFKEKLISKFLFIFLFVVFTAGFLVTLSRATIITYMIILLILLAKNNLKSIFINLYLTIMMLVGLYVSWDLISSSKIFVKRIANPSNVIGRWNQYKECLNIFSDNMLAGIGYGVYKKTHMYVIHNSYLKDLVELGLPGFLFHMTFIFSVIFSSFKKILLKGSSHLLKTRIAFIMVLVIVPNTIDLLDNQYFMLLLFLMVAVLNVYPEANGDAIDAR